MVTVCPHQTVMQSITFLSREVIFRNLTRKRWKAIEMRTLKMDFVNMTVTERHVPLKMQKKGELCNILKLNFLKRFFLLVAFHPRRIHECQLPVFKPHHTHHQLIFSIVLHPLPHFLMGSIMH